MKCFLMRERFLIVEMISAISFFVMSIALTGIKYSSPDGQGSLFWVVLFTVFALLQGAGIAFLRDMILLRIIMTWVAGSVWTWISYANMNSVLVVPMFLVGIANFVSFVDLSNRATIDWREFFQE
jgi:hypothetical protein